MNYDLGRLGQGGGKFYYAHDDLPDLYANGLPTRTDRNLYSWRHALTNSSGLTIHGLVNGQNDPLIVRDFYENQFRRDLQPKTFFEVNQAWPNWTLDLLVQPQLIEFYQTVERLPDESLRAAAALQWIVSFAFKRVVLEQHRSSRPFPSLHNYFPRRLNPVRLGSVRMCRTRV